MEPSIRWVLFEYKGLELVILSKPFKTKELAEKARRFAPTTGAVNKCTSIMSLLFVYETTY